MQAISMLLSKCNYTIDYIGFDFFEDAKCIDLSKTNPGVHKNLHSDPNFYICMHTRTISNLLNPLCHSVQLVKGDMLALLPITKTANNADMYYIDGAHTYTAVEQNYLCVKAIAKNNSLVIFDDTNFSEINRYISHLTKSNVAITNVGSMSYTIISK
jgi:hypothetical protein